MAVSEVIPLSKPGILKKSPAGCSTRRDRWRSGLGALPGILPWFLRFLACARHSKIVEIAEDTATLTHQVYEDYGPLLAACPDKSLMGQRPIIELFDTPAGRD